MSLFSSNNALLRGSYWHVVKRSIGEQPLCIWRQTLRTGLTSTLVGKRSLGIFRVDCKLATFCAASDGKFRQYDGISVWVATKINIWINISTSAGNIYRHLVCGVTRTMSNLHCRHSPSGIVRTIVNNLYHFPIPLLVLKIASSEQNECISPKSW